MSDMIHIVCLDAPSPPDYGGAIDMFYKITTLAKQGKKITLHYFDYRKNRNASLLEPYCAAIYAYPRKHFLRSLSFQAPYIVKSRVHPGLIARLNADNHPILLEGLHCSGILPRIHEAGRVIVRMHNDEARYYASLASVEKHLFKKWYYAWEAARIRTYQKSLPKNLPLACLSSEDLLHFQEDYGFRETRFVPCFLPWQALHSLPGKGQYCLYHGNMAIRENEAAALWLLEKVFCHLRIPLVIAGKNLSGRVQTVAKKYPYCRLVNNPPEDELNGLIRDAHINVLPSHNNTGVKLKLLHALFEGRFCLTNSRGIQGSQIPCGVAVADTTDAFISQVRESFEREFTSADREARQSLVSLYNNEATAQKLSELW
ncbi:MAG: glycosyltransferase [Flavisolibacter sp.]